MRAKSTVRKAVLLGVICAVAVSWAAPGALAASKKGMAVFAVG
jgi:hypothetical protein